MKIKRHDVTSYTPESVDSVFGAPLEHVTIANRSTPLKFLYFVLLSILMGALCVLPVAGLTMLGVQAATPAANVWKAIPNKLPDVAIAGRNTIYDKDGNIIGQTWDENRIQLKSLQDISPNLVKALVNTEDKNFYHNKGYNIIGIGRAAVTGNGGGSGITQQLVKNLLFYNLLGNSSSQAVQKSYVRKVKELKLATEYEKTHTKDQILLNYFNTVAFGSPSLYGIETASQHFFGKPAKNLNLAESAALVGTENNPVIFNMDSKKAYPYWKNRQRIVLNSMVSAHTITRAQADSAYKEKLNLVMKNLGGGSCTTTKYPFYCYYTMNYLIKSGRLGSTVDESKAVLSKGGLEIHTYVDSNAMNTMNSYLSKNWGNDNRIVAPTALVQPGTGGLVGMAVNRTLGSGKGQTEIDLPNTPTGEGSVYKLFTLAAAAKAGMTADDLQFYSECPLYPGRNYDYPAGGFKNSSSCALQGGYKNFKEAAALSSNTWFVTLEMKVGVDAVKKFSKSVGLSAPDYITNRSLSYTLGVVPNSPIDLAAAIATFSNKGVYCPPTPVASLKYSDGTTPAYPDGYNPASTACRAVMTPAQASIVAQAMHADVDGEVKNAFGLKANIPGIDNGGKSGTNQLLNSSWTQITGYYTSFTNVYDMTNTARGIDGAVFKGYAHPWSQNTAQETGSDIMKELMQGKKNIPLDWYSDDNTLQKITVNQMQFINVPSVIGMAPAQALSTLQSLGIESGVSKETVIAPENYPSGVIVRQSIAPGTNLNKGTKKTLILYVSK